MTWAQLREMARAILAIVPGGDFTDQGFTTSSGGGPVNKLGLPEVHRSAERRYLTTSNGWAYAGEVVVRCRDTGARDAQQDTIWETPEGVLFVYRHTPGDPMSFDRGHFETPLLE